MADNVTLNQNDTAGKVIATDEDGSGVQHQYVKLEFGDDGVFTKVSATNKLPVDTGLDISALATSAKQDTLSTRIGDLTEAAPATDTASSGLNGRLQRIAQRITSFIALIPSALTGSGNFKVAVQEALPAGTNAIGKLAANDGVDIGDVTINNASIAVTQSTATNLKTQAEQYVGGTAVSSSNPVPTTEVAPTSIVNGKTTVTTAGTRVQLATNTCKSITIKALSANTGTIYVGNSSVASSNGFALDAGDTVSMDISNTNVVYIDSSVNGEGITWIAVN